MYKLMIILFFTLLSNEVFAGASVLSGAKRNVSVSRYQMDSFHYSCLSESKFVANLTDNSADLDLYIKKWETPTTSLYDCRSVLNGTNDEKCSVPVYQSNNSIVVGVYGYASGSGSLTAGCVSKLKDPCTDCDYSGPYDRDWHGDNTTHLGKDYPAFVGDSVQAIADGTVYAVYTSIGGFGGTNPSRNGSAIVIKHKKANGKFFYALYGHVLSNVSTNAKIKKGDKIGTVDHYYWGSGNEQEDWPHLHFGIWDSETSFPTSQLGYGPDRSFVNPVNFLADEEGMTLQ